MMSPQNRRRFLQQSLIGGAGLGLASNATHGWLHAAAAEASQQERILVVIQLSGGNDGLNTIVPYGDEAYYRARAKLAIAADAVHKINDELGFNPAMADLARSLEDGRMGIVQGVGYQQPNRSHFESMDIWHTCQRKQDRSGQGWLGRWLGGQRTGENADALALHLGQEQQPLALAGRGVTVPSIASLKQFRFQLGDRDALKREVMELAHSASPSKSTSGLSNDSAAAGTAFELLNFVQASTQTAIEASQRLETATSTGKDSGDFPSSQLGEKLHIISQLIASDLPTRIYYVTLDGFDTHAQQPGAHTALLRQWSEALAAFLKRIDQHGYADRVLAMTFSEFGRRVAENASDGTDHGAAAPLFLCGPKFKSTLVGEHPSLTDLDDGDLKFHTDFRSVYATIIEKWFGASDSEAILGASFSTLDVFA